MDLCSRGVVKLAGLSIFDMGHCLILTTSEGYVPGAVPPTRVTTEPDHLLTGLFSKPMQFDIVQAAAKTLD